jgi:hypothetical protein
VRSAPRRDLHSGFGEAAGEPLAEELNKGAEAVLCGAKMLGQLGEELFVRSGGATEAEVRLERGLNQHALFVEAARRQDAEEAVRELGGAAVAVGALLEVDIEAPAVETLSERTGEALAVRPLALAHAVKRIEHLMLDLRGGLQLSVFFREKGKRLQPSERAHSGFEGGGRAGEAVHNAAVDVGG